MSEMDLIDFIGRNFMIIVGILCGISGLRSGIKKGKQLAHKNKEQKVESVNE